MSDLVLKPHFSWVLFCLLLVAHIGAVVCLFFSGIAFVWQLISVFLIFIYFIYCLRVYVLKSTKRSIVAITCENNQKWRLLFADGRSNIANLLDSSLVTRHLVILNFKVPGFLFKYSSPLFSDSESSENLRKLRLILLSQR